MIELIKQPKILTPDTAQQHRHEVFQNKLADNIVVQTIYFWVEFDLQEKPVSMTAAFTYFSKAYGPLQFGETWTVDEAWGPTTRKAYQKKLCGKMVETLDVLVHHGDKILDSRGNINFRELQDAEAERFFRDPLWADRLGAFTKVVIVKVINFKKAQELKLI